MDRAGPASAVGKVSRRNIVGTSLHDRGTDRRHIDADREFIRGKVRIRSSAWLQHI